jgi:hypothetical protein
VMGTGRKSLLGAGERKNSSQRHVSLRQEPLCARTL